MTGVTQTLSSRALCPGSIPQLAPEVEDGWIPVTSTGMTTSQMLLGILREGLAR